MRINAKNGSVNETMILKTLDNHHYKDLSNKWKRHISRMFKEIKDDDLIKVNYYQYKDAKPDLEIIVNERKVYLSIKSGHSPSMHYEPIFTFTRYLREIGVPSRIIGIIYFYHYGINRRKGINEIPLSRDEILAKYPSLIKECNDYFASHEEIIIELIYRAIIKGRFKRDLIDYFYYGNPAKGYLLSISDIIKLITNKKYGQLNTLCFGPLTYVPCSRDPKSEKHNNLKINWPILCAFFYDESFMKIYG